MNAGSAGGRRLGRVIAWTVAIAGILATAFIALFPFVGQLIAASTWSLAERDACQATPGCSVSVLPVDATYAWVGLSWVALIVVAIAVCWPPRRWWTPTGQVSALRPGVFSTPEWFRLHAFAALAINAIGLAITGGRMQDAWVWQYLWPIGLAVGALVLATVCVRTTASQIDAQTREGLMKSYDLLWLTRKERLARSEAGPPAVRPEGPGLRRAARRSGAADD